MDTMQPHHVVSAVVVPTGDDNSLIVAVTDDGAVYGLEVISGAELWTDFYGPWRPMPVVPNTEAELKQAAVASVALMEQSRAVDE